jgi:hypothetical protein
MEEKQVYQCPNCGAGRHEENVMCWNCGKESIRSKLSQSWRPFTKSVFGYISTICFLSPCIGVPIFTLWKYGFAWGLLGLLFPMVISVLVFLLWQHNYNQMLRDIKKQEEINKQKEEDKNKENDEFC